MENIDMPTIDDDVFQLVLIYFAKARGISSLVSCCEQIRVESSTENSR